MFSLREYRQPTHRLPDLLPWAALVDAGVVLQKDGLLQKTLAFRGPDLASSSPSELVAGVARLNNALQRLGSRLGALRRGSAHESPTRYPRRPGRQPAAWLVDTRARDNFEAPAPTSSRATTSPSSGSLPSQREARAEALFYEDPDEGPPNQTSARAIWRPSRRPSPSSSTSWRGVFAEVRELDDDETLTYLHSHHLHQPPPRTAPGDPDVPRRACCRTWPSRPGDIPMLGDALHPDLHHRGLPAGTAYPGILDDLNHLPSSTAG